MAPHNLDAEESVLGAMMLSEAACDAVAHILDAADFYRASHGRIYQAAIALHRLGQPVDAITVADRLEQLGQLADIGGRERVHEIAVLVPAASNAGHYAGIVAREARRRGYLELGQQIQREALEHQDPDLIHDHAAILLDGARPEHATPHRVARLDQFLEVQEDHAEALAGDTSNTLLPAGGLLIVGGEGGASKTTLTLDAVAHLASGTEWLGYPVARPLRILIVENEGPRPQFRAKLRAKADSWPGNEWRHNVHVWEEPWSQFTFADPGLRRALQDTAHDLELDLVVADPLDSLGVIGAGTPEDVRTFIAWLKECGLHNPEQPLAFWLLHHFNKTGHRSVVAQLSGAWGGHPDAILGVELGDSQTTKLTWGKLRHATPPANKTTVLQWNIDTRGFHPLEQRRAEEPQPGLVDQAVTAYVTAHPGTVTSRVEEAVWIDLKPHEVTRAHVRRTIERLTTGDDAPLAVRAGESSRGKYLFLAQTDHSPFAGTLFGERRERADDLSHSPFADMPTANAADPRMEPHPSQTEPFAAELPAPPKGGPDIGERTETANTTSFAEPPDENASPSADGAAASRVRVPLPRAEAERWVREVGWMSSSLDVELVERWPLLAAAVIGELLELGRELAAAEAGG